MIMHWTLSSAAVFAGSGETLRGLESPLGSLKPGKPLYRKKDITNFRFWFSVPWQLSSWQLMDNPVLGGFKAMFECTGAEQASLLARKTLKMFQRPLDGLATLSLTLFSDRRVYVYQNLAANTVQFNLASSNAFGNFPVDLVEPWHKTKNSTITLKDGKTIRINWDMQEVLEQFHASQPGDVQFVAPISDVDDAFLGAVENRLESGVDYAQCMLSMPQQQFHDTLGQLMADLPGYVNTGMITCYRKGFDPYVRPSDADEGHSVRFPVFEKDLRSGSILQVDVVHRPVGDCFFDIQVMNPRAPDKPLKDLKKLITGLEMPYQIWEGAPLARWR